MSIKPTKNYIVAAPVKEEAKSASGLYIRSTDSLVSQPYLETLAVGDDVTNVKPKQLFTYKYITSQVKLDGIDYVIVHDLDVTGIVE